MLWSNPYVLLGPTYSGKTSLLIQLACILAKLEKVSRWRNILRANFPNGEFRSAVDACKYAEPTETFHLDYLTLSRYVGSVSWIAPSGDPKEDFSLKDFQYALGMQPSVIGFVIDIGTSFELGEQDLVSGIIKINKHFYRDLFNKINESGVEYIQALKVSKKVIFFNKVDYPLSAGYSIQEIIRITKRLLNDIGSLADEELGFNPLKNASIKSNNLTYAKKVDYLDPKLKPYRINALRLLIEPVNERLTSEGRRLLQSILKSSGET